MKTIKGFGIELQPLLESQLEMIRRWRNAPEVAKFMTFQDYITPEMHQNWYKSINNDQNEYYIIYLDGIALGVVHLKNIRESDKTAEWGIYLGQTKHRKAKLGTRAALLLHQYGFDQLELKKIKATILIDNEPSIKFHLKLGYSITPGHENQRIQAYWLDPISFKSKKEAIILSLRDSD